MQYLRALAVLLVVALLTCGAAAYQDKDKDAKDKKDKEEKKIKGTLPQYYKSLGLTDNQKQKVYKIRADYKDKLDELEKAKAKLKAEEKEACEKVLNAEQLKELKKIRSGEKDK
jgi:Spy/CpxP family protein refolding chaperone